VYRQWLRTRRTRFRCLLGRRCLPGFRNGCPAGLQRLRRPLERLILRRCSGRRRLARRTGLAGALKGPSPGEALHPVGERLHPGADPSRRQSTSSHRQRRRKDLPGQEEPGPKERWERRREGPPQRGLAGRRERLPPVEAKEPGPKGQLEGLLLPVGPGKDGWPVRADLGSRRRQLYAERSRLGGVRRPMRPWARRRCRPQPHRSLAWVPGLYPLQRGMEWSIRLPGTTAQRPVPRQHPLTLPGQAG
jgi:hypothetical protein